MLITRYFFRSYFFKAGVLSVFITLLLAYILLDNLPFAFSTKVLLLVLPNAIKLSVPLAMAIAWLLNRHTLQNSGEWQALTLFGLSWHKCYLFIWAFGIGVIFAANIPDVHDLTDLKVIGVSKLTDKNKLIYMQGQNKTVIVAKDNAIEITADNGKSFTKFHRGQSEPVLTVTVKNSSISSDFKAPAEFNIFAIASLWTLLLFLAVNIRLAIFYEILSVLGAFIINVQLIKWLGAGIISILLPLFLLMPLFIILD